MPIISISVDDEVLKDAEDAICKGYFKNKSDLFRKGAKAAIAEIKNIRLPSHADAVLIAIHEEKYENEITVIKHSFESIITMQTHSKVNEKQCLEIFVLKGDGPRIIRLAGEIYSNKHIKYSKLIAP